MEPLADDHSSDSEDTSIGVEESAAPAVAAGPERESRHESSWVAASNPYDFRYQAPNVTAHRLCVVHKSKKAVVHNSGPGARVSVQRHQRARSCLCQSRRCQHLLVQKELSFVVAPLSIRSSRLFPCVFTFFASSITCTLSGVK